MFKLAEYNVTHSASYNYSVDASFLCSSSSSYFGSSEFAVLSLLLQLLPVPRVFFTESFLPHVVVVQSLYRVK